MTLMQPTPAQSSNGPYVRGTLSFLNPLDDFLGDAEELVAEAIEDALHLARVEIRDAALRDARWAPYAGILDVEYDNGEFHYVLATDDEEVLQSALDLEYGTDGNAPHSLIRKLARTQPASIANSITEDISAEVPVG